MANSRVKLTDIQVGKPLPWSVFDANGVLLLSKGRIIANESQVQRLIGIGVYAPEAELERTRGEPEPPQEQLSVANLLMIARKKLELLVMHIEAVIKDDSFTTRIAEIVELVDKACTQESNVALAMILLKQDGRYSTRHMVNVATVVRLVARTIGMAPEDERGLVAAALTMNLTMVDFQDQLHKQSAPLTPHQREILDLHPLECRSLLIRAGVTNPLWLTAVQQHHEQVDGSGYPNKLKAADFSKEGQILGLADVFCARITPKVYRPAVASNIALRGILLERGKAFDPTLAAIFIKTLGVFPPGLLVKLANGEIGVVYRTGTSANNPIVSSFINAQGEPMTMALKRDTKLDGYAIVEAVDPKSFSAYVRMENIWGPAAAM